MDTNKFLNIIDERKEELFNLLSSLVKINSESFGDHGNEEELAKHIFSLCKELGLEADMFSPLEIEDFENHPDYFPGRNLKNRYNVVARYKGEENIDELMIMGHIDTVKIGDLANWESDPISGKIEDGKIFGRGACDNKYALAVSLFLMKLLKEEGFKPKRNLLFGAYCDEEYGGSHGALSTVLKYPCTRILSADGREEEVWNCASGGGEMKYLFRTKEPVDSAKKAALAIPVVIEALSKFGERRKKELEENDFYKGTIIPETSLRYMGVKAGNGGADLDRGEVYFVFYTDKTKEEIYKEFDEIEKDLKKALDPLGIEGIGFKAATRFFHYGFCDKDCDDIALLLEAANEATGKVPSVCGPCLSDMSVILKYGSSRAFAYGAGRAFGKKGGSHQPNEFIECDKLVTYTKNIAAYILKVLG